MVVLGYPLQLGSDLGHDNQFQLLVPFNFTDLHACTFKVLVPLFGVALLDDVAPSF